jgi:5-methylcytosine-specific restriction endonuclease McrA
MRDVDYFVLLLRDQEVCHICGQGPASDDPWHIEHVIPKLRGRGGGGSDDLGNLALAHKSCNLAKSAKAISRKAGAP